MSILTVVLLVLGWLRVFDGDFTIIAAVGSRHCFPVKLMLTFMSLG